MINRLLLAIIIASFPATWWLWGLANATNVVCQLAVLAAVGAELRRKARIRAGRITLMDMVHVFGDSVEKILERFGNPAADGTYFLPDAVPDQGRLKYFAFFGTSVVVVVTALCSEILSILEYRVLPEMLAVCAAAITAIVLRIVCWPIIAVAIEFHKAQNYLENHKPDSKQHSDDEPEHNR